MKSLPIIAIDGPSASGKGTLARRLAAHYNFSYLDTGALYRAVGLKFLQNGGDPADADAAAQTARALDPAQLLTMADDPALRQDAISVAASKVAAIPTVRAALLKFQEDFCVSPPFGKTGAVLDGRDIGTVIAPDAAVKIYVTASLEARVQRRLKELQGRGAVVSYDAVLKDMIERDARDAERAVAPSRPAHDAITLDTSNLTPDQAFRAAIGIVDSKL